VSGSQAALLRARDLLKRTTGATSIAIRDSAGVLRVVQDMVKTLVLLRRLAFGPSSGTLVVQITFLSPMRWISNFQPRNPPLHPPRRLRSTAYLLARLPILGWCECGRPLPCCVGRKTLVSLTVETPLCDRSGALYFSCSCFVQTVR
jgi:hypothetical protein